MDSTFYTEVSYQEYLEMEKNNSALSGSLFVRVKEFLLGILSEFDEGLYFSSSENPIALIRFGFQINSLWLDLLQEKQLRERMGIEQLGEQVQNQQEIDGRQEEYSNVKSPEEISKNVNIEKLEIKDEGKNLCQEEKIIEKKEKMLENKDAKLMTLMKSQKLKMQKRSKQKVEHSNEDNLEEKEGLQKYMRKSLHFQNLNQEVAKVEEERYSRLNFLNLKQTNKSSGKPIERSSERSSTKMIEHAKEDNLESIEISRMINYLKKKQVEHSKEDIEEVNRIMLYLAKKLAQVIQTDESPRKPIERSSPKRIEHTKKDNLESIEISRMINYLIQKQMVEHSKKDFEEVSTIMLYLTKKLRQTNKSSGKPIQRSSERSSTKMIEHAKEDNLSEKESRSWDLPKYFHNQNLNQAVFKRQEMIPSSRKSRLLAQLQEKLKIRDSKVRKIEKSNNKRNYHD